MKISIIAGSIGNFSNTVSLLSLPLPLEPLKQLLYNNIVGDLVCCCKQTTYC